MRVQYIDELLTWCHTTSPERALLAAVLERAVRDLGETMESHHTREAIQWFHANGNSKKYEPFSFNRVVEELDLNSFHICAIEERIREAEKRFGPRD